MEIAKLEITAPPCHDHQTGLAVVRAWVSLMLDTWATWHMRYAASLALTHSFIRVNVCELLKLSFSTPQSLFDIFIAKIDI